MKTGRVESVVLIAYTAATLWSTFPLILHLGSAIPGGGDAWQFYWNLWWVKRALVDLHTNPFTTPDLYYPYGASLYFHTLNLLPSLLASPVTVSVNIAFAYNAVVLTSFIVSAYATYRLTLYVLTANNDQSDRSSSPAVHMASFIAGLTFAFCAYRFVHTLGHLDLLSTQWLPLSALFLLKSRDRPGWRNPAIASLFLAATALTSWYYLLFILVFAGLCLIHPWAGPSTARSGRSGRSFLSSLTSLISLISLSSWWKGVSRVALSLTLLVAMISPIVVQMLLLGRTEGRTIDPSHDVSRFSLDLLALVTPSYLHPILGHHVLPVYQAFDRSNSGIEAVAFLGFVTMALAAVGVSRRVMRRQWLAAFALFVTLALGPVAHFGGKAITPEWLPMPYRILEATPYGDIPRVPARFIVMAQLSLSVMAGAGTSTLLRHLHSRTALITTIVLSALVLWENSVGALRLSPIEIPRYYQVLASDASNGALLEVPIPEDPAQFPRRMLYQTVHTKPVHGGYVSRGRPPFPFEGMPGFSQFTTLSNHIDDVIAYVDAELPALSVSVLMAYGTARVVVDKAAISVDDVARVRLVAQRLFGDAPPSYEDDQTLVFDVRRLPVSPSPFIWIERGWSYLERDNEPSGTTTKWRWMGRQARVGTLVPRPARARLRINARSLGQPRHLRLAIGSAQVDDIIVAADRATYETASFDLPGGVSFIDLASDVTRPGTADPRLLSVAVFQLSLLVEATSQP